MAISIRCHTRKTDVVYLIGGIFLFYTPFSTLGWGIVSMETSSLDLPVESSESDDKLVVPLMKGVTHVGDKILLNISGRK